MAGGSSRIVSLFALLLVVWGVTYWLYNPGPRDAGAAPITAGKPPASLDSITPPSLAGVEPVDAQPVPTPLQPTPLKPTYDQPTAPPVTQYKDVLVPPKFTRYTVQKGDTSFEAISLRIYKTAKHAKAISQANKFVTPNKLRVGQTVLNIPEDPENIEGKIVRVAVSGPGAPAAPVQPKAEEPPAAKGRLYKVQPSDTLSDIAKKFYGKSSMWKKIAEANKTAIPNPERLRSGIEIIVPD